MSLFLNFVKKGVLVCNCPRLSHFDDIGSQKWVKFNDYADDKSHPKIPIRTSEFSKVEVDLLRRETEADAYPAAAKKDDRTIFSII